MANNIQVNKIDTSGQECWDVLYNVDTVGTKTGILKTAGTLLDRNIKLNITTPAAGAMSLNITDKSTTNITIGTKSGSYYPLSTSLTGKATFASAGWITTNEISATDSSVIVGRIAAGSITPTYTNSGLDTYFNSGSSSDYSIYITPQYTNTAGYIPAHSTAINGNPVYLTIKQAGTMSLSITDKSTTNITVGTKSGNYYPLSTSLTGKAIFASAGWITTNGASATDSSVIVGRIAAASFSNSATSGTTYVDISSTTAAPMLSSGGYLYINKGYVDNLKISLAKLIPNWPSGTSAATANYLLQGYKAYDQDGGILTGTIPTKQNTDVVFNGANITIPKGYFASNTTVTMQSAEGSVTMTAGAGSCSYDSCENIGTATTNTTGIKITFKGSGSVSATAEVTTAGYTPTNNSFAIGAATSSNSATASRWITGVKLTPPTGNTHRRFKIVVPNGSTTEFINFVFDVDKNGNVVIESDTENDL